MLEIGGDSFTDHGEIVSDISTGQRVVLPQIKQKLQSIAFL